MTTEPLARLNALYLALWFPCLSTDRLRREKQINADRALVATRRAGSGVVLAAVDALAASEGLAPGMTLASARAIHPDLRAEPLDPAADAALVQRLADWCDRYSPLVAVAGSDRLVIEATGCTHLFGGEKAMLTDARDRLCRTGLSVRAALAASPGAAIALALHGSQDCVVSERRGLSTALADLPVSALALAEGAMDREALTGMHRVGLHHLGDLYQLPRAALATRFGPAVVSALDRLLGQASHPIAPRRPTTPYRFRLAFADPIGLRSDIDAALVQLLLDLSQQLQEKAMGCRRLTLTACRADGTVQEITIGTSRPVRAVPPLMRLLAEKLESLDPGFGIDCLILTAPIVEPFEHDQIDSRALAEESGTGGTTADDRLASVCDRLINRLGGENLFRLAPVDSRLPDTAQGQRPAVSSRRDPASDWPRTVGRPTRLLGQPIPLVPLHAPRPGDPLVRFRLRGREHRVRIAQGPERIAPDWWRRDAAWVAGARDYWQVEDEAGQRFWIYRDGTAGAPAGSDSGSGVESGKADTPRPHWFLHGLW